MGLTLTRKRPDGTVEEVEAEKLWERAERAEARAEDYFRTLQGMGTDLAIRDQRIAALEGLLDEARKWLENFPGPEYRSNIECWEIGVGTFLPRARAALAGKGES